MREIKFRVWDEKLKVIFPVDYLEKQYGRWLINGNDPYWFHLMPFTGLTDKNGVEIYEGDIISRNGDNLEIKWHDEYCYYKLAKRHGRLTRFKAELSEVIGNIHQTPELLCAKK